MRIQSLLILVSVLAILTPSQSMAKDEIAKNETPITKWIAAENALLDTLPKQNKDVFFVLRNKHGVMRSIKMVQRDVKNAVDACGKENADLKAPMRARYKDWEKAVNPILKEADKFLKTELKQQEAFHVSDYRHIMKLNDKAYEFSESQIQKTPVTSPEACQGLLESMDSTEDKLVSLLQTILLPEDVVRERLEQESKKK